MQLGSWRDVQQSPAAAVALVCSFLVFGVVVPMLLFEISGLVIGVLALVLGGAGVAVAMARRGGAPSIAGAREPETSHRGPNVSRIPVAGLPGLVLAVGFVFMFWFGVPAFRPIVVGIVFVGAIAGGVRVLTNRWHRVPTGTPLGLNQRPGQPDAPAEPKGPR